MSQVALEECPSCRMHLHLTPPMNSANDMSGRFKVICPPPSGCALGNIRDWYFIAEQPAPAPHLAHPGGCAAYALCYLLCPVLAALASIFRMDSISTSYWGTSNTDPPPPWEPTVGFSHHPTCHSVKFEGFVGSKF